MSGLRLDEGYLRRWLSSWNAGDLSHVAEPSDDSLLERLRQVLNGMADGTVSGAADLVPLLRQWMLRCASVAGAQWLRVPRQAPWPEAAVWQDAGFDVVDQGSALELRAAKPRLPWLGEQADLFDDAFALLPARQPTWVVAEPFLEALLGVSSFTGPGQREAVRALLQAPPDVALIANLPTGSGKSLLAQLPPLTHREGFLTLVILPTVALALDQERRMNELFARQDPTWKAQPLAYHGGLTTAQRAAIFQAIRAGRQRVLFTGPEAATGTLRRALIDTATAGRLTHIVVDEAHIVATWGSGFRPSFQLIPSLVRTLRARCPAQSSIRVVLASATLTEHTVRALRQLFGPPACTEVISAVYLRPEPRYAALACSAEPEKRERVLEALRFAPRPYILYVTRPEEAEAWVGALRQAGFRRVASFTGDTSATDRQSLLRAWERNELDGMVATSAFGLGVDKGDVRTIIHATLPESLDRFYQEVGRSGRDGLASASLLLFTAADVAQASGMGSKSLIGNEIGYDRWLAMVDHSFHVDPASSELWVSLNAVRPELKTTGASNLRWNLRTLNLMASAGILELTGLAAGDPRRPVDVDIEGAFDYELSFAAVRLLRVDHRDRGTFDRLMNEARRGYEETSREAFGGMLAIATQRIPVERGLAQLYRLVGNGLWAPVDPLCGGCSAHWKDRPRAALVPRPVVDRLRRFDSGSARRWPASLPKVSHALALVALEDVRHALQDAPVLPALLARLKPHTLLLPCDAPLPCLDAARAVLARLRSETFLDFFDPKDPTTLGGGEHETRVLLWTGIDITADALSALWVSPGALCVVLIGRGVPDPWRPDRRLADVLDSANEDEIIHAMTS